TGGEHPMSRPVKCTLSNMTSLLSAVARTLRGENRHLSRPSFANRRRSRRVHSARFGLEVIEDRTMMTQFSLSQNTQNLINTAISSGPGTNNVNYLNAYNAIYSDLKANGNINPGTLNWFSQAGEVNTQLFSPSAAGTFIWNYTESAVASAGGTL